MPQITLPDGSQRPFEHPVTVAEVAASIGAGLAKAALAGKVDGKLVDTSFRIEADAALEIVTEKHPDALEVLRHSTAHLLAQAVQRLFPGAQVTRICGSDNNSVVARSRSARSAMMSSLFLVSSDFNFARVRK